MTEIDPDPIDRPGDFARALEVLRRDAEAVDDGVFPSAGMAALADAGIMGLTVGAEQGGAGPDPARFVDVVRRLAAECGSTAMVYLMHSCATAVVSAAPPPGLPDVAAGLASGRLLGTLAYSEPGSRSHFWAPVSEAASAGSNVRLSGSKSWVTSAGHADVYVASCRAVPAQRNGTKEGGSGGIDQYVLRAGTPGFEVAGNWSGLGLRGNASAPMTMDVEVREDHRLGNSGDGFGLMMGTVLPWFNLGNAAVSLGLARGAQDAAVAHVRSARLEHLSSSLADLPTIRAYLAKAEVALRAGEALLAATARSMMVPDEGTMAAVLAIKAAGNETALEVTDTAMRVCGGAAFSRRLGIERRFRDARAGHVMAPTSDALYDFLGRLMCGIDLFA